MTDDDTVAEAAAPDAAAREALAPEAVRDSRPSWAVVAVALSVAVVALGVALYALLLGGGPSDDEVRESALEAARERTVVITSYDHRTLDATFMQVLDLAVGSFRTDYATTTEQLRATFTSQQAVAVGRVVAVGLESAQEDRAVAVVAVDQVITTKDAAPRTERNRLRMTLVRPDGTWLVERVERL